MYRWIYYYPRKVGKNVVVEEDVESISNSSNNNTTTPLVVACSIQMHVLPLVVI
jgi:hypothetical protein